MKDTEFKCQTLPKGGFLCPQKQKKVDMMKIPIKPTSDYAFYVHQERSNGNVEQEFLFPSP